MDEAVKLEDFILLFDTYSNDSKMLHDSFQKAGYNCDAIVIEDDGFLPDTVQSVYAFFLGKFGTDGTTSGRPRYFNEIVVPEYWQISGNNSNGKINDLYRERGKIFYAEPKNKRLVRVVDWYDERGVVRSSDHYNRCGALYARTIFNAKGQKVNKSYFSPSGKEIIVENYVTGDIILNDKEEVRIFPSKIDLVMHFFEKAGLMNKRIFFNSLSTSFFVSQRMPEKQEKCDILFWQEAPRADIPGNMQVILNGQAKRTEYVIVQKKASYNKLISLGAASDKVSQLGYIYPFEKENLHRPEALICTNSERIEHCSKIIEALPQMHFHIAALTEMSSKLMSVGAYQNVTLYPGVKTEILEELFDKCDFYFDINHESEIVSAVYKAFLHNHLIYAFNETKHNADYVAAENVYLSKDVDRMTDDIKAVMAEPEEITARLKKQHEIAGAESAEAYCGFN